MTWPPTLADLKLDKNFPESDTLDDASLQMCLDAAIARVERVRSDLNFTNDPASDSPLPDADVFLGCVRLAGRWFERRKSPDGVVEMGELGNGRIPSFDPDIEQLLRVGRYRAPVIA